MPLSNGSSRTWLVMRQSKMSTLLRCLQWMWHLNNHLTLPLLLSLACFWLTSESTSAFFCPILPPLFSLIDHWTLNFFSFYPALYLHYFLSQIIQFFLTLFAILAMLSSPHHTIPHPSHPETPWPTAPILQLPPGSTPIPLYPQSGVPPLLLRLLPCEE